MAILTAEARRKLKDSDFAIPSERKYPIHNPDHARNALARVSEFGSPEEKKMVRAAVHKKYPNMGKDDHDGDEDNDTLPGEGATDSKDNNSDGQANLRKMWKK